MDSINNYLHLNRVQNSNTEILDKEIQDILSKYPTLKEKYGNDLTKENYKSLRPWLLRALKDQEPCQDCTNFFACPKKSRRGFYYEMNYDKCEVVNKPCAKRNEVYKYKSLLTYGEENYEEVFNVYFQMIKVKENIKNPKTEFFKASSEIMKAITGGVTHQFYIKTSNENKKILAYFGAAIGLTKQYKTVIIDPTLRLNFLRLDNNQDNLNEFLEIQKLVNDAKVVIIENFDTFKRYSTSLDNLVLPLIKSACTNGKVLILTGEDDFNNTITPLSNYAKPHSMILSKLTDLSKFEFNEPVFYNVK